MGRSGSYYDDFQRYGRRSQYDYRRYLPSYRESDEERAIRKADERRAYEERHRREQERHDPPHRDDDIQKRKTHDERGKGHMDDSSSKRAKLMKKQCRQFLKMFLLNLLPPFVPTFKQSSTDPHTKLGKVLPLFKVDSLSGA